MTTPPTNPQESEPREWTINQMGSQDSSDQIFGPIITNYEGVAVIEKSAYDKLKAELAEANAEVEAMLVNRNHYCEVYQRTEKQLTEARAEIERYKTQAKTLDDAVDRMKSEADSNNSAYDELSMWLDEEKRATALQFKEINELKAEIERLHTKYDFQLLVTREESREKLLTTLASALECWEGHSTTCTYCDPFDTAKNTSRAAHAAYESWKGKA